MSMNDNIWVALIGLLGSGAGSLIGVLTSSYHVFRARRIAKRWGLDGISGISAKSDLLLFPHLCVRECVAILKDQLMGNM